MSASVMEAVETSTVARMLTIAGITSSKAVSSGKMFGKRKAEDEDLVAQTLPDSYPGAVVSMMERDTRELETNQGPSSAWSRLETAAAIAIYATSPSGGVVPNDARYKAWEIAEAVQKSFLLFTPEGVPAGVTVWPMRFGGLAEIPVDATTHGIVIMYLAEYQFAVIA